MTVDDYVIPDYPQHVIFTMTSLAEHTIFLWNGQPYGAPEGLPAGQSQFAYRAFPQNSGINTNLREVNGRYTAC